MRLLVVLVVSAESAFFDFETTSPGWSTGGTQPPSFPFTRDSGGTPSGSTGPSAGADGSVYYYYAETSSPRQQGDLFTLSYDGSACPSHVIASVTFQYHMWGRNIGVLRLVTGSGVVAFSLSGNQGNAWRTSTTQVDSPTFRFEYSRGADYTGDAAIDAVNVSCGLRPSTVPTVATSARILAVDGTISLPVVVDDVTDGGRWVLLWCYDHLGGTNPALVPGVLPMDNASAASGCFSHAHVRDLRQALGEVSLGP